MHYLCMEATWPAGRRVWKDRISFSSCVVDISQPPAAKFSPPMLCTLIIIYACAHVQYMW